MIIAALPVTLLYLGTILVIRGMESRRRRARDEGRYRAGARRKSPGPQSALASDLRKRRRYSAGVQPYCLTKVGGDGWRR